MASWTTERGMEVPDAPTGDAGLRLKQNFVWKAGTNQTASDPTTSSDSTQNYYVGSRWLNTSTKLLWICVDNTASAAIWVPAFRLASGALQVDDTLVVNVPAAADKGLAVKAKASQTGYLLELQDSSGSKLSGVGPDGEFNCGAATTLTIASGAVTAAKSYHKIETESGAGTDDLDTINGGVEGDVLVVRAATAGHTVVVKNATGNLRLNGNYSLVTTSVALVLLFDGTNWIEITRAGRRALTTSTTFYVRTDGSDSNDGSANDAAHAFLTIGGAYNYICQYIDTASQTATIQVGAGTYTSTTLIDKGWTGGGQVIIQGDTSTPANVFLSVTSNHCFLVTGSLPSILTLRGFKLKTTTSGYALCHQGVGVIYYSNMEFSNVATGSVHVFANAQTATIIGTGNYTISAGAGYHLLAIRGTIGINGITITLTGTPAFSSGFAVGDRLAFIDAEGTTFSGSATGKRYASASNSYIFTNGGGANYFPGNVAGTTSTGGLYA